MRHAAAATVYLQADDVVALHADLFGVSVETAEHRVRDRSGLNAACARPQMHAHYDAGGDLALQAAALAQGICQGHVFTDGNKRTAVVAMGTFLQANGYSAFAGAKEKARWMVALSKGGSMTDCANCLRPLLLPLTGRRWRLYELLRHAVPKGLLRRRRFYDRHGRAQ